MAFTPTPSPTYSATPTAVRSVSTLRVRRAQPGLPIAFVRGALFGVNDRCRDRIEAQELRVHGDTSLHYSGPRLNQHHSLLWQAIVTLALEQAHTSDEAVEPEWVTVTSAALLRRIGWKDTSTSSRRWLWSRLVELQSARLELQTPRHRYSGLLLTDVLRDETSVSAPLQLRVNPRAVDLLKNEVVLIDFERKLELAGKQLALWLHDFISSQSNTAFIPVPVDKLRLLCGSRQALAQFRPRLIEAAKVLQTTKQPLIQTFHIDKLDRLVFAKTSTRVVILPEAAANAQAMQTKAASAVDQARARRARVAL